MLSQEVHPLKVMGDPALQKESSHKIGRASCRERV